jgi:hypothetical protein
MGKLALTALEDTARKILTFKTHITGPGIPNSLVKLLCTGPGCGAKLRILGNLFASCLVKSTTPILECP